MKTKLDVIHLLVEFRVSFNEFGHPIVKMHGRRTSDMYSKRIKKICTTYHLEICVSQCSNSTSALDLNSSIFSFSAKLLGFHKPRNFLAQYPMINFWSLWSLG